MREIRETQSLGLKNPLLPPKPLGQVGWPTQFLNSLGNSGATILQPRLERLLTEQESGGAGERGSRRAGESRSGGGSQETPEATDTEIRVNQLMVEDQESLSLPTVLDTLTQINSLSHSIGLGQESLQTLQLLPLAREHPPSNQAAQEFSKIERIPENLADNFPKTNSVANNSHQGYSQVSLASNTDLPASWSSLAELIAESSSPDTQESIDDDVEGLIFTPEGFQKANSLAVQAGHSIFPNLPHRSRKEDTLSKSQPDQDGTSSFGQETTVSLSSPYLKEEDTVSEANLEILAREVYHLIRRRLQIDRERYGRKM